MRLKCLKEPNGKWKQWKNNNNKFSSFPFTQNNNTNLDKFANYIYLHHIRMDFMLLVPLSKDLPPLNDSLCMYFVLLYACLNRLNGKCEHSKQIYLQYLRPIYTAAAAAAVETKWNCTHIWEIRKFKHTKAVFMARNTFFFFFKYETTEVIFIWLLCKFHFFISEILCALQNDNELKMVSLFSAGYALAEPFYIEYTLYIY